MPDVKVIYKSIANISPVLEIMQETDEAHLLHGISQDYIPARDARNKYDKENYVLSFAPIPKSCRYLDCPLCHLDIEVLKTPHVFKVGLPTEHPDVVKANLRYQTRCKNRLKIMHAAMTSFEMTTNLFQALDSMDSDDAKEEEQQEQNNSELGEES
jgi:hypothetical protein